jgi:hypothetical protein
MAAGVGERQVVAIVIQESDRDGNTENHSGDCALELRDIGICGERGEGARG